jgi:hypothetical protein
MIEGGSETSMTGVASSVTTSGEHRRALDGRREHTFLAIIDFRRVWLLSNDHAVQILIAGSVLRASIRSRQIASRSRFCHFALVATVPDLLCRCQRVMSGSFRRTRILRTSSMATISKISCNEGFDISVSNIEDQMIVYPKSRAATSSKVTAMTLTSNAR